MPALELMCPRPGLRARAGQGPRCAPPPPPGQLNDLHLLDPRAWAWVRVALRGAPSLRGCATLCAVPAAACGTRGSNPTGQQSSTALLLT